MICFHYFFDNFRFENLTKHSTKTSHIINLGHPFYIKALFFLFIWYSNSFLKKSEISSFTEKKIKINNITN